MPLRLTSLTIILITMSSFANAKDAVIFDVRRPLAMTNGEVLPQDFYINIGSEEGMKEDMVVTVTRRQTMYDAYTNKSPGDLIVPVGKLRVIHVQNGMSVARVEQIMDRSGLPVVDYDAVMVGDRLDMGTAKVSPRKTASLEIKMEVLKASDSSGSSGSVDSSSVIPQIAPASAPVPN